MISMFKKNQDGLPKVETITTGIVPDRETEWITLAGITETFFLFYIPDERDAEGLPKNWRVSVAYIARHSKHFGQDIRLLPVEELYALHLEAREFILKLAEIDDLKEKAHLALKEVYKEKDWQTTGKAGGIWAAQDELSTRWKEIARNPTSNFERLPSHYDGGFGRDTDYVLMQIRASFASIPWLQWVNTAYEMKYLADYHDTLAEIRVDQELQDFEASEAESGQGTNTLN